MACVSVRSPAFMNPTTMTVVALELWITAVTARPSRKPLKGFSVRRLRIFCSRLPACRSRDLPIRSMPYKNSARPPSREKTCVMLMVYPRFCGLGMLLFTDTLQAFALSIVQGCKM